jgi:hypothetical protein
MLSDRRFEHALGVVRSRLKELVASEAIGDSWAEIVHDLGAAEGETDPRLFKQVIFRAYRRVLFDRDPATKDIPIPASQEEWISSPSGGWPDGPYRVGLSPNFESRLADLQEQDEDFHQEVTEILTALGRHGPGHMSPDRLPVEYLPPIVIRALTVDLPSTRGYVGSMRLSLSSSDTCT